MYIAGLDPFAIMWREKVVEVALRAGVTLQTKVSPVMRQAAATAIVIIPR
jgi:hypothetical protein